MFAAKAARTKMEEQPVATVPETEEKADFIVAKPEPRPEGGNARGERRRKLAAAPAEPAAPAPEAAGEEKDEFDLSDITATPKEMSREDIIAMAEAAAFCRGRGRPGQKRLAIGRPIQRFPRSHSSHAGCGSGKTLFRAAVAVTWPAPPRPRPRWPCGSRPARALL